MRRLGRSSLAVLAVVVMVWGSPGPVAAAPRASERESAPQVTIDREPGMGLPSVDYQSDAVATRRGDDRPQPALHDPAYVSGMSSSDPADAGVPDPTPVDPAPVAAERDVTMTPNAGPYTLSGVVTNAGSAPLAGIIVEACMISNTCDNTTTTAADGTYSFSVGSGNWTLRYSDPAGIYARGYYNASEVNQFSQGTPRAVEVVSSDVPGISLVLPVALHVTGTVTNAASQPLAGIRVHLTGDGDFAATTAADGSYSVALASGTFTASFNDNSMTYMLGWYSLSGWTGDRDAASPIVVEDEDVCVDIVLPPWPHLIGRVVDEQGNGIDDIRVIVYAQPAWSVYTVASTDSDGSYSVRVYEGSQYSFWFEDIENDYGEGWLGDSGLVNDEALARPVVGPSGDLALPDVVLPELPHLKGKVTDSGGVGIAGIDVRACVFEQLFGIRRCGNVAHYTSADGSYSIRIGGTGTLWVKVTDPTYTYVSGWYAGSGFAKEDSDATPIDYDDASILGIDVVMPAYLHMTGRATDSASAGLSDVTVTAYSSADPEHVYMTTQTLADGTYSLPVEDGSYAVSFGSVPGYSGGWWTPTGWSWAQDPLAVVIISGFDVNGINIALPPLLHLTGRVTDLEMAPVSGIHVTAYPMAGQTTSATTGADGTYSLGLPPGTYDIEVVRTAGCLCGWYASSGYVYERLDATPVILDSEDVAGIDVAMPGILHIKGTVLLDSGLGYSGFTVELYRGGGKYASTTTGTGGAYSFQVPPGTYRVHFAGDSTHASGWYGESGFVIGSDDALRIRMTTTDVIADVILPRVAYVHGRVIVPGNVAVYFQVEAWVDGSYYGDAYYTSTGGSYVVRVPPGNVTLFFYEGTGRFAFGWRTTSGGVAYDWRLAATTVVSSGDVYDVNVTLPAARHIKGKVTNSAGQGLGDVLVVAQANGSDAAWGWTASDGTYSLPVTPGTYTLRFEDIHKICASGWRTTSGFTADPRSVSAVTVSSVDLTGMNITLPAVRTISGRLTDRYMHALDGIEVDAIVNGSYYAGTLSANGSYVIRVAPGTYRIGIYDDDWVYRNGYYNSAGYVYNYGDATVVSTTSASQVLNTIALPLLEVPDAPAGVTAYVWNQAVSVYWDEPVDNGGMEPYSSTVTASPGGATCESEYYLFCTVTGLDNGTAYTFTVTTTNVIGTSAPSAPSSPATPAAVPDEPSAVRAVGADGSAVVTWTAPADNGSPITGYTVSAWPGGATCTWTSGPLTCTVTGLSNGTYYWLEVGATNANGTGPEGYSSAVANPKLVRYGGANVFATAAAISANTFPTHCYCTAYIAYGGNFPDALAGAAAAGSNPGPMLFVNTSGAIDAATAAELTRLQPNRIVVLGSEIVISASVYNALHAYGPVYRYAGNDRFATASTVSGRTFWADCHCTAYIAYAMNFPDALAAAAAAGTVPGPVLLVSTTGTLSAATTAELKRIKPTKIVVLGSTVVISATVFNALKAYAPAGQTFRYYGTSRYDTAASISSHTFAADCGCVAYVAAGTDFNGALSGAAAAGYINGPLLLVGTTGAIPTSTKNELTRLKPVRIVVLGGTDKVSVAVFNALAPYAPAP